MIHAPLPANETERLEKLRSYHVLDTEGEECFDELTRLASTICGCPISLITLVDVERQWFKSKIGLTDTETPRTSAFCAHTILQENVMVVNDATKDTRFFDNPLVTGAPDIRFYAGAPLTTPDGFRIGILCVIDRIPRDLTPEQEAALATLGRQVISQLELRNTVTALRHRERELHRTSATLQGFINASPLAIFALDEKRRVKLWNPAAEDLLGWRAHEVLEKPFAAIEEALKSFLQTVCATNAPQETEFLMQRKDGSVFDASVSGALIARESDEPPTAIFLLSDVSSRKEVDRMKSEFVAIVSHELRTPLTSIHAALGLLAGGILAKDPGRAQKVLTIAVSNTERLNRLINDILDVERIESGTITLECTECNAAELIAEACDGMQGMASRAGVTLSYTAAPIRFFADSDRMLQTLTNLIGNAIKFSCAGQEIQVHAEERNSHAIFHVKDQGRGIPKDKLETIFLKFRQVDASDSREKGGSGLGLAICRAIIEQHGGRIWVESEIGQGSVFSFEVPIALSSPGTQKVPS